MKIYDFSFNFMITLIDFEFPVLLGRLRFYHVFIDSRKSFKFFSLVHAEEAINSPRSFHFLCCKKLKKKSEKKREK